MTEHTHPQPVLWNWQQHHRERQRAEAIAANLPSYEQRVAETGELLEELQAEYERRAFEAHQVIAQARADYATQGREHKLACDNAAMLYRIVAHECANLDLPLPPEPAEVPLRPTEAIPATGPATRPQALPAGDGRGDGLMAWQQAPAPDPLGDPVSGPWQVPPLDGQPAGLPPENAPYRTDHERWQGGVADTCHCGGGIVPGDQGRPWVHVVDGSTWCRPDDPASPVAAPVAAREDGDAPELGRFQPGPAQEGETNG